MPRLKPPPLKIRSGHNVRDVVYKARNWNGISVYSVTQYSAPVKCWQSLTGEQALVTVVLEQLDGFCEPRKRVNAPVPRHRYDAGHTMYAPPNVEVWGYGDSITMLRALRMRFDLDAVEKLLTDECDRQKWNDPVFLLYDERLRQIAELIWKECDEEEEESPLYGESLTTALFARLFTTARSQNRASQAGLGRLQFRRVAEYIDANLLGELRLAELAQVTGLSPSQFARSFKVSTGLSPHRWITQRRVQWAQRFMKETGKSISLAAHQAGFANQSHFTKAFRSVTGITPGLWLKDATPIRSRNKNLQEDGIAILGNSK